MSHSSVSEISRQSLPIAEAQSPTGQENKSDPQSDHIKLKFWWLLPIVGLLGGLLWLMLRDQSESQSQAAEATPVELQRLESDRIRESTAFVGQLEAQQGITLQAETEGRVTQIFAESGDTVAAGDPIVQLSPNRSEAEYRGAIANVRAAQASRSNAIAQLEVAEADRISAASEVSLQQKELQRNEMLVSRGALPQQELDRTLRDIESAQATESAAARRVNAARAQLSQAEADVDNSQADAAAVREDLDDTLVVAPISGRVGEMSMKLGDYVTSATPLTTIIQNDTLDLEMAIPIERRGELRLGMPVELLDGEGVVSTGSLSFIAPQTSSNTQTVQAEATFRNPTRQIQDAQRVRSRIIWTERPGLLIPTTAISRVGGATFVYVAVPGAEAETEGPGSEQNGGGQNSGEQNSGETENSESSVPALVAQQRSVELGDIQGNEYQAISGLEAGERIVTSGILNVSDGTAITSKSAAESEPGSPSETSAETDAESAQENNSNG